MTDRIKGVVVTFDTSLRLDDAETVINAIKMLKHVIEVEPVQDGYGDRMNRTRVKTLAKIALLQALENLDD
jgi:hypothetical protein